MSGFFNLNTPTDLLAKLDRERLRMQSSPSSVDHAFNFFVTAEHLLDWLHPGDAGRPERESMRRKHKLLQVTSHLANGAKHFNNLSRHHKSVTKTERGGGYFPSGWFGKGWFAKGYFAEPGLYVELSSDEAIEFGPRTSAIELAEAIHSFWKARLDVT